MIYVGIDDTDMPGTPGTNQLARDLVRRVAPRFECRMIVRHQLLADPRVPCTSKNGSASIHLVARGAGADLGWLMQSLREGMRAWFVPGSDPGLCVAESVPEEVLAFGTRCQRELVSQETARDLAARHGMHLEGLGGTEGGVIGALAAVALAAMGDDGRIVQLGAWPDNLSGPQDLEAIRARGIAVRRLDTGDLVDEGKVDVGKHLRPNRRRRSPVLFVRPHADPTLAAWHAVRLA
ncbi:MAG: hypothetical protein NUV77_16525 [Thermoguttaceae bacterium]|nr:hypothetical protein [Thermoguttaceae bacterium]